LAMRVAPQGLQPGMQVVRTLAAEVPGQEEEEFLQVGIERRVVPLLDAEFDANRHSSRRQDQVNRSLYIGTLNPSLPYPLVDRHAQQDSADLVEPDRVRTEELGVFAIAAQDQGQDRSEQKGICAGTELQVQVRYLRYFGAARVDDEQMAARIALD